jgi:hypothetical protein
LVALAAYLLFVLAVGFLGSVCYEWTERTEKFLPKSLLRTIAWFWIGMAGLLLSALIKVTGA